MEQAGLKHGRQEHHSDLAVCIPGTLTIGAAWSALLSSIFGSKIEGQSPTSGGRGLWATPQDEGGVGDFLIGRSDPEFNPDSFIPSD